MASRSDTDSRLIEVMRTLEKDINTSASLAVQPSLGDVITWDGRDYKSEMSADELLNKTGAKIEPKDTGSFFWTKTIGRATVQRTELSATMNAEVAVELNGAGVNASETTSVGWQADHEDAKSIILRCGCDGGQSIQNTDDFFGAVCDAYKKNNGWKHNHWGIVDTVFWSSYRVFSWSKTKHTGYLLAVSSKKEASVPIPDTPADAKIGGEEALAINLMQNSVEGDLIVWPENGEMESLASGTLKQFVIGWTMSRLDGDLKKNTRWFP